MLRERKYYLVNLANLSSVNDDDIGSLGIALKHLLSENINIPFGFIITTSAFDDFLVANDLVDFIAPRINDIDYSNLGQIQENSKQIQEAIKNGKFPDLIKDPIEKSYAGLSSFSQANVSLRVSVHNQELSDSLRGTTMSLQNVWGLDDLLENIKQFWAEFFSPSAILYRGKIGYEGFLTESIVAQRSMQAEVSGRLYSVNPTDNDPEFIEIQAIWGMELPEVLNDVVPDSYFFSKKSAQLVEKKIITQDHMFVRKARFDKKEPFLKVQISKMWQNKQKLDNKYLFQLFHYTLTLERIFKKPFIMDWVLESGKICVTDLRDIDINVPVEEKYPLKSQPFESQDINDYDGSSVVITPSEQMESYVDEINTEVKEHQDTSKLDADDVIAKTAAKEGELMSEDALSDAEKQISSVTQIAKGLSEDALVQEESKAQLPKVEEVPEFKKSEEVVAPAVAVLDVQKVEVDIKQLKELPSVAKGESGLDKSINFGLTKIVRKLYDLEDLTGDEILVFENISLQDIDFINKVKGAVVRGFINPTLLNLIRVPVVFGNQKFLEEIQDNLVITIDGNTGKVYLGAGIKDEKKFVKEPELTLEVPSPQASVIPKRVEVVPAVEVKQDELQDELKKIVGSIIPEKEYVISVDDSKENIPINSATEMWQVLDSRKMVLNTKNAKGLFLCSDDLYKILNVNMGLVVSDAIEQKSFIKRCVYFIDEIIQKSGSIQLMLLSCSKSELSKSGYLPRIDDFINIDLEILSILRNDFSYRNIWYGFNDIHNAEELFERKKNVTSEGMRRSVSFKLFACLKESYPLFGIKSIVENNNIDGVIIDIDAVMEGFAGGKKQMDDIVANLLKYVLSFVNSNNKIVFVLNNNIAILPQHFKQLLEAGLMYYITASQNLLNNKLAIVDQEVSRIERRKKRGRKKKVIDFGF